MSPPKASLIRGEARKNALADIASRVHHSYLIRKNKFKLNKKIFSNILIKMHLSINSNKFNGILVLGPTCSKCSDRPISITTNSSAQSIGTPYGVRCQCKIPGRCSSKKHIEIFLEIRMDNSLITYHSFKTKECKIYRQIEISSLIGTSEV